MGGACGAVEINGKYIFALFLYNRKSKPRIREAGKISRILW